MVDIKHIKAELTLDCQEARGPGHGHAPPQPAPSLPHHGRARLRAEAQGHPGHGRPQAAACKFEAKDEKLAITLDKPYGPEDTLDLAIAYAGSPESGLHFVPPDPAYPEKPLAIWTQGEAEDTHHWLPCYDYPNDRVTTEMIITVAKPLSVVSNGVAGRAPGRTPTARGPIHWKMDQPHSTYLITLAAAEFVAFHDKVGDLPVDYYVTKNVDEATARRFMGKTPGMIRFFSEKTGQPYPYPKYAQVCLPEFGGGMENTSATSMTDAALLDEIEALERDEDGLVAHELAHQWFGDLLTCKDWSHIWLNEGFASYFDPLFAEHDLGEDEFRLRMDGELKSYLGNDRHVPPADRRDAVQLAHGDVRRHDLCQGRVRAAHAPRPARRRGLVEGHPRLRRQAQVPGRRHRRLPQGHGRGLGQGPEMVLRPVALQGRAIPSSRSAGTTRMPTRRCASRSSRPRSSTNRRRCSACRRRWRSPRPRASRG